MAPSKRRTVMERKPATAHSVRDCPCLDRPQSNGICELNLWQGTTIDRESVASGQRLLRSDLPVVKYKEWSPWGVSGHMYHMVVLGWIPLLALFSAVYIALVGVFALFFAACDLHVPDSKVNVRDFFNLSLQTMATIGYGVIFPEDRCSNWVAVVESFVSMIATSLMTGVAFVKFARPRPHMIFSEVFTVSQRDIGGLEMRFRAVNATPRTEITRGEILEVSFKLILMRVESTNDGDKKLCYYDLRLKTTNFIALRLEAELVHHVDVDSPFYGMSADEVERSDFLLILMMSGVDENLHDMIYQQMEYTRERMRWGAKFLPFLTWDAATKHRVVDFNHISATVPSPIDPNEYTLVDVETSALSTETQHNFEDENIQQALSESGDDGRSADFSRFRMRGLDPAPRNRLTRANSRRKRTDYSDLESIQGVQDDSFVDDEEEMESKSVVSTRTNSGSENEERHEAPPVHRVRFDQRSRISSIRLPRLSHHRHTDRPRDNSAHEQPMSVLRRRVRFKNNPFSRFSKGFYYRALEMSWPRLFMWLGVIYFAVIVGIALLMHISYDKVLLETNEVDVVNKYERIFFFCAQTLSTIGYGALSPNPDSDLINFYVFVLVLAGVIVSTLLTGLAWAKFSIPKASTMVFSENLLLTAFHGHRAIVFRAANNRTFGVIIEGSFRVSVVIMNHQLNRKETHELTLVRNVWPIVQLGTTVTHIIDEDSPLFTMDTDELLSGEHFFVVLFTGLDSIVGEYMFSRKTYHSCDILVGHHFVDNIKLAVDGLHIDLVAINETVLMPEIDLRDSRLYSAGQLRRAQPDVELTARSVEAIRQDEREVDEEENRVRQYLEASRADDPNVEITSPRCHYERIDH
ncbi:hypothetical protein Poli38472_000874 [Pythium oligandrum]|uniref:Inward rectifier potassium channel C-terminal domain-containing protein n=1 Tax=Pythium oligandrum TaxID=41045 RepID=A0A8K1CCQ9_PYTOL|nr:hypothetical protein Poli38472_000874 [Pythium oligandrum]|eukprot:TMW60832.1 hypothetical protein Poli38472_000874 [Pythium oligandrum]